MEWFGYLMANASQTLLQTAYINYLEGSIPIEAYYGPNLAWLKTVKRRWDPEAYWSTNPLAIPPAASA